MGLFNKLSKKYIMIIVLSTLFLAVFVIANKIGSKYSVSFIINSIYMNIAETDEYKSGFEETKYKNYKILHKTDLEVALPIIYYYLDELELESKALFNYIPTKELTIQIDYNEKIFKKRHNLASDMDDVAGYYNKSTKTMYLYVEDVYRDVIVNLPKVTGKNIGAITTDNYFKETLFHEYFHHVYNNFLEDNNIKDETIPRWFEEGLSSYMQKSTGFEEVKLEFISLDKLKTSDDWVKSANEKGKINPYIQSNYSVYKLINLYDENTIKDIILNCENNTFEESFKIVTKDSLDNFEKIVIDDYDNYSKIYDQVYEVLNSAQFNEIKIKCIEEYIKVNEDDIRPYEFLSTYYGSDFNKVEKFLKESIKKHPKEPVLYRHLAIIYEQNNKMDLAAEYFEKANELDN